MKSDADVVMNLQNGNELAISGTFTVSVYAVKEGYDNSFPFTLQAQAEEGAEAPFGVVHLEAFLVADIGEIVHHRHTEELVAYLPQDGSATGDDDFGEMIVKGDTGAAKGQRGFAIDDERGNGGDVEQPTTGRHIVVAVAAADADVRHLELHLLCGQDLADLQFFTLHGSFLSLTRDCQQEAAG